MELIKNIAPVYETSKIRAYYCQNNAKRIIQVWKINKSRKHRMKLI